MNIKDKDFMIAFKLMEGNAGANMKGDVSVSYAMENFDRKAQEYVKYELIMGETEETMNMGHVIQTIYGNGGWNRYYVLATGEVVFSKMHSGPDSHINAESLGFRLW